jgi:hypothetical protein
VELRINRTRALIGLASLAITFVFIAISVAPRSHGELIEPAPEPTGNCFDLARTVDPSKERVDTEYDPERDVVIAEYRGRRYEMSPNDPACRALAPARAAIDGMMSANRENMAVACSAMRDLAFSTRTEMRGRRVNKDAARKFIAKHCEGQPR